jgi:hypothetical protein
MPYVKIKDNVVIQKQPRKAEGFVEAPDTVVCGMLYDGKNFTNPPPAPKEPEPLSDLEQLAKNLLYIGKITEAEIPQGIRERIVENNRR